MLMRTHREFAITVACYGVAMLALAYGVWIAGQPLAQTRASFAGASSVAQDCAECSRTEQIATGERRA